MPSLDAARDTAPLQITMYQPAEERKKTSVKIPWKQFTCAGLLIVVGIGIIIVSSLILEGLIDSESMSDLSEILLIVGVFALFCGLCYVLMTIRASHRMPGYSLDNIPKFG